MNKRKFLKTIGAALVLPIFIAKAEEKKKKTLPNVAIGCESLKHNTFAGQNVAIGVSAMTETTTGSACMPLGNSALKY